MPADRHTAVLERRVLGVVIPVLLLVTGGAVIARTTLRAGNAAVGVLIPAATTQPPEPGTAAVTRGPHPTGTCPSPCRPAAIDLAQVDSYLGRLSGPAGIVIRDRATGRTWRAGQTAHVTWTASTIKLAIATSVLERARAGQISLTTTDRANLAEMLHSSSNNAADALWSKFGADAMVTRFRTAYGMKTIKRIPGDQPVWRGYACSTEDLLNLMSYVLDRADPTTRGYLVSALRTVAPNQHWGVWSAGSRHTPGNKNGWAVKPDPGGSHWVIRSVGFAGPGERYAVAVTHSLPPNTPMATGVHSISDLVALAFNSPTPAPVTLP